MILLCPENPSLWNNRPITWALLAANVFMFIVFFANPPETSATRMLTPEDLRTAGHVALAQLRSLPTEERAHEPQWLFELDEGDAAQMSLLGSYSVRDSRLLTRLEQGELEGDAVAITHLRKSLIAFHKALTDEPLFRFGLNAEQKRSFAWVTYQFAHAGWIHLLSNLVFLAFVGFAIEGMFGGSTLLAVYLIGGFAGGFLFLALNPYGLMPMVGASGAVSAMIAFYAVAEKRRRIRYYYFIFPSENLQGFIYLPTLLILPLYLASDLGGLLSSPAGIMSGVAYAAHIGGAFVGGLAAWNIRVFDSVLGRPRGG